jgi:hypothetical protein
MNNNLNSLLQLAGYSKVTQLWLFQTDSDNLLGLKTKIVTSTTVRTLAISSLIHHRFSATQLSAKRDYDEQSHNMALKSWLHVQNRKLNKIQMGQEIMPLRGLHFNVLCLLRIRFVVEAFT